MAKNPNKKNHSVRKDEPMTGAMKFFLAACVAELYLLVIRRFYINADSELTRIAWFDRYLWILAGVCGAVFVVALVAALALRKKPSKAGKDLWYVTGVGAFACVATVLTRLNMASLSLMTVLVPVVMLLGILWALYDRECALALTVLGVSLLVLWIFRRYGSSIYVGTAVKVVVAIYAVALVVLAAMVKTRKLEKFLPASADGMQVMVSCIVSAVVLLAAVAVTSISYYAIWALAVVLFALAVYDTVKQL